VRSEFLVFGAPDLRQPEIDEVVATLKCGWIGTGPRVAQFERQFAAFKGVDAGCVAAVNSCTAALHVSMVAAGIGPGDEVITTPLTFGATVNAILHAGATPVLADVDPDSMNIDLQQLEHAIKPRTRALLPVHFAGRPCDMRSICAIAAKHGLLVVEDCAHAIEAEYGGVKTGTFGDFGCFSLYVTKNVTSGEGGFIIARDPASIDRVKRLALHGMAKDAWKRFSDSGFVHYDITDCGFKYNMMDIQAAIGMHQLARVSEGWERRRAVWARYLEALAGLPVRCPAPVVADAKHSYHLFTILVDENVAGISRDRFLAAMTERRIGVGVHYRALPEHPYYREHLGWRPEDYPVATPIGRQTVSLPLSSRLTEDDVEDVLDAVRAIVSDTAR
jgi:dTDP-4-amino-4,6-dideoxygalactose transaminase